MKDTVTLNDQIFKILRRYPQIDQKLDFSFGYSDEMDLYVNECLKQTKHASDIDQVFSKSNPELVKLLKQMLEINPYFRPSAKQLLKNKLFDKIRRKADVLQAPFRVKINIDEKEWAINYEDLDYKNELKESLLKKLL